MWLVDESLYIASVLDACCCTAPTSLTGYAALRPRRALTIELTAVGNDSITMEITIN